MITAQEAKVLYDKSGSEVQDYLTHNIEKQIVSRSESGERYYTHHLGSCEYEPPKLSPLLEGVMAELKRLEYRVMYVNFGEKYVPRGLAEDDGTGPLFQNYGFTISW